MAGAWEEAIKRSIEQCLENVKKELMGIPYEKTVYVKSKYYKWRCLEDHTRSQQDIHGTIEFKKDQIVESTCETKEQFAWVVDVTKFERIEE